MTANIYALLYTLYTDQDGGMTIMHIEQTGIVEIEHMSSQPSYFAIQKSFHPIPRNIDNTSRQLWLDNSTGRPVRVIQGLRGEHSRRWTQGQQTLQKLQ